MSRFFQSVLLLLTSAWYVLSRTSDTVFLCGINQAWDSVQCIDCSDGCSCSSSLLQGACDSCTLGYIEYNPTKIINAIGSTVCKSCQPECGTECCFNYITSVQVCSSCPEKYYLSSWFCRRCLDPNCKICDDFGVCTACEDGYFLNTVGICQPCVGDSCATCDSTGACITCPNGRYVDTNTSSCILCTSNGALEQGCLVCKQSTPSRCKTCDSYNYVDGQGKCRLVAFCDNIEVIGEKCNSCADGYYMKLGKCVVCPQTGAARCSSAIAIIQCENDKALSSDGSVCVSKINNCIQYTNTGPCSSCNTRAMFLGTGVCYLTCAAAIPNCTTCVNGSSSLSVTCSACASGYFPGLGANVCIACNDKGSGGMLGCATCSYSGTFTCSSCASGFISSAGICVGCTPDLKGTGCSTCSSTTVCSSCLTNSFTSAGTCNLCDVSCAQCTEKGYRNCLTSCSSNLYYIDNTTECRKCKLGMQGCLKCSSKIACTTCMDNYYASTDATLIGTALQCQRFVGCKVPNAGVSCALCKAGYTPLNGGCVLCQTQSCVQTCEATAKIIVINGQLLLPIPVIILLALFVFFQ